MHLTILGTSDTHGCLWGYRYEDYTETANTGLARLYTCVQGIRHKNPHTILLDAGDILQGSILTDSVYNKTPDSAHPMMTAMNLMRYDAITLGNHEFNIGTVSLKKILSQSACPVLAANILNKDGTLFTGKGWTILPCGGVRVAVIGVVTPNIPLWDSDKEGVAELTFLPASVAVKQAIGQIGKDADVIVVSAHMGLHAEFDEDDGSDSGQKILDENPEVDVLQLAHMHILVNEVQGRTVIGGCRSEGRDLVRFDLELDKNNRITRHSVTLLDMENYAPSSAFRSHPDIAAAHRHVMDLVAAGDIEPDTGTSDVCIGYSNAKFQPEDEIKGIPQSIMQPTALPSLINHIQLVMTGADVSSTPLYAPDADIAEGVIRFGDVLRFYPFDNLLYRVNVTGAELKAYMEWSAAAYRQWMTGDINICLNEDRPGFLYDVFAGIDYELDLSRPAGNRVQNVRFKGEPLQDDAVLRLAVNNFRYSSILKGNRIVKAKRDWASHAMIRTLVTDYITAHSPLDPFVLNNWRIVGVDLACGDPRRQELVRKINAGHLEINCHKCYHIRNENAPQKHSFAAAAHHANMEDNNMSLSITKTQDAPRTVVALSGRLDTTTAPELESSLRALLPDTDALVLDFAQLSYISSAGLRVLLVAQKEMSKKKGHFSLLHVNDVVMEVLEVTGFVDILTIE